MFRSAVFTIAAAVCTSLVAGEITSGLQVGGTPSQFNVKDCTGPAAGKTLCYFCRYGRRPVVGIFTREINDNFGELVRRIDEQVRQNRNKRLAAFVVYVTDEPFSGTKRLKALAAKHGIAKIPLTIYQDKPEKLTHQYKLADDAKITVLMWVDVRVKSNTAFREAELKPAQMRRLLAETARLIE